MRAPNRRAARAPLSPVTSTDHVQLAVHDLGVAGGSTALHDIGTSDGGDARPVLLVHATGFHGWVWQPLAAHLTGFHAVAPDMRGHGDSTVPTGREAGREMGWDGFADDVLAVVEAWGVDDLVGVGHSKGGAALLLAEQRRPGTFRALWLYEPVVLPTGASFGDVTGTAEPDNPLAAAALRRRATFASRQAAYDNYASKPPLDVLDPAALHAYVDHGFRDQPDGTVALKCLPAVEADVFRQASQADVFAGLGQVRCPVTIACGADLFGPAAFAPQVAAALPAGRLETFDDLGHFGPLQRPAEMAAAIVSDLA